MAAGSDSGCHNFCAAESQMGALAHASDERRSSVKARVHYSVIFTSTAFPNMLADIFL